MSTQVVEVSDGSIVVTTDVGLNGATKQSVADEATARANADIALTAALALKAPLASPALTGTPTAPTAATATSTTQLATTAFVQQELAAGGSTARALVVSVRNQSGGTMAAGTIVYLNGATGNLPTIAKALATSDATSAQTIGLVRTSIADNGTGLVVVRGVLGNLNTSTLTEGQQLYLSPTTAGAYTTTKQYAPNHLVYIGVVTRAHPTLGSIEVAVQNGFELDELHDVWAQSPTNGDTIRYNSTTSLWEKSALGTAAVLNAGSSAGNVPVLDANGDLVGPIIGRMILFSDTTTVPSLGEQFTAVNSLTAPTQIEYRLGDGVTAGGVVSALNASNLTSGTVPEARIAVPSPSTTVSGIRRELLYGANVTASYGYLYVAQATSATTRTFTDPATEQANGWYAVLSTRASVVIGGFTYPPQATPIIRQYDIASEVWRTRATFCPVPASAAASGQVGDMSYDASYLYVCTAANTWRRVAISTW